MTFKVIMTERAAREIRAAAAWWAQERSAAEAEHWYEGIWNAITRLATFPRRCAMVVEPKGLPYEVRELHYGNGAATHRIVFAVVEERVVVLTVRHFARAPLESDDLTM